MSLDWDMTKVKDFDTLGKDAEQRTITDMLVWGSLALDLGEITAKNIDEWLFRLAAYERCTGHGQGIKDGKAFNPDHDDLVRRIGMRTNVRTTTRKQFLKKCMSRLEKYCNGKSA